ncbi:hypothetical protein EI94DRAFT_1699552 [Lactarius quietus]|nr:hypothetical protein EI94DRAFT_1699552 [Lactarius quietus]
MPYPPLPIAHKLNAWEEDTAHPSSLCPPLRLLCRLCLAPPLARKPGHARVRCWTLEGRVRASREGMQGQGWHVPIEGRAGWNATWTVEDERGGAPLILDQAWEWLGSETSTHTHTHTCTCTRTGPWHRNHGSGG